MALTLQIDTISLIHSTFTDHISDIVNSDSPQHIVQLTTFKPATTADLRTITTSSPSQSCNLDSLPNVLLKACLDVLIKPITNIIHASLYSSLFPESFKYAHVNPVLKKTTLPKEELIK